MKKKQKQNADPLCCELKEYMHQGVELWLDHKPSSVKKITRAHKICESGVYMRDYVRDEEGKLVKIEFNVIRNER